MEGSCQCGAVRYKIDTAKPMKLYACHCHGQLSTCFPVRCCYREDSLLTANCKNRVQKGKSSWTWSEVHQANSHKQSASAYGLSAVFPLSALHFEQATSLMQWQRTTDNGTVKECWFCNICGSRLYHHGVGSDLITVKAGSLESLTREMLDEAVHIWVKVCVQR